MDLWVKCLRRHLNLISVTYPSPHMSETSSVKGSWRQARSYLCSAERNQHFCWALPVIRGRFLLIYFGGKKNNRTLAKKWDAHSVFKWHFCFLFFFFLFFFVLNVHDKITSICIWPSASKAYVYTQKKKKNGMQSVN